MQERNKLYTVEPLAAPRCMDSVTRKASPEHAWKLIMRLMSGDCPRVWRSPHTAVLSIFAVLPFRNPFRYRSIGDGTVVPALMSNK